MQIFSSLVWMASATVSAASMLRGEGQDVAQLGFVVPMEHHGGVDVSGSHGPLTEEEVYDLLNNVFRDEPWIQKNDVWKHDPLEYFDKAYLEANTELDFEYSSPDSLVFDLVDRLTQKGYRTEGFPSIPSFLLWLNTMQQQNPQFAQRYHVLPSPSVTHPFYWLASTGLQAGNWREASIGGVTWREVAMFSFIGTYPSCLNPSQPDPANPFLAFSEIIGARKGIVEAGSTVTVVTDPFGNKYYQMGRRSPNNLIPFPGWSIGNTTLTEDYETGCLYSKHVPKNNKGEDGIVCKQLQFIDMLGNVYFLVDVDGPGHKATLPTVNVPYSMSPLQCLTVSFTEPQEP